jgi:SAM-dependent methyltransferase
MQTPAEKCLIKNILDTFKDKPQGTTVPFLVNLGAGRSLVLENSLIAGGLNYLSDRVDVIDCSVKHPAVRQAYLASVEAMPQLATGAYDLALANYVLEHVKDLNKAAAEISRILKSGALFITSLPNPQAPEFFLARHTPLWFHQWVKGHDAYAEAHETHYVYKNISQLISIFQNQGFSLVKSEYQSFTFGYLYRFPVFKTISQGYDWLINRLKIKRFQGNVCLVFKKSES